MLKKINKQFFLDRLKEASTWRGIIAVLTALGVDISPELALKIISVGMGLFGSVGILFPDKKE